MNERICFVHVGMGRGGAERVISRLANKYAEIGYKVDIIVLLSDECGYGLKKDIKIESFVRDDYSRKRNVFYWLHHIRRYVKENKPKHIISFSMYVNLLVLLACMGLKKDVLISERIDPSCDGRGALIKLITRILYPFADKIVFQTKRASEYFSNRIRKKSRVITNPIDVTCEAVKTKKNKIVTVGRLHPQKNQKLLIYAFSIVIEEYPDYILEIYGEGHLRDELIDYSKELGIEDRVHFMGNVPNVHECIKDAKVFVLSSDFEGLSNALLEAMMMGLPCISSNCAGADEVLIHGYNGMLVDVGDVDGFVNNIKSLLSNDKLCDSLAENAKECSIRFRSDYVVDEWINYIGE